MTSTLVPLILNTDTTVADFTADTYKPLLNADPLEFEQDRQNLTKQSLAITNPAQYITDKNNALKLAQVRVYKNWVTNMKRDLTAGMTEKMARAKNDSIAKGEWDGEIIANENQYPMDAFGVAKKSQVLRNTQMFDFIDKKLEISNKARKKIIDSMKEEKKSRKK